MQTNDKNINIFQQWRVRPCIGYIVLHILFKMAANFTQNLTIYNVNENIIVSIGITLSIIYSENWVQKLIKTDFFNRPVTYTKTSAQF